MTILYIMSILYLIFLIIFGALSVLYILIILILSFLIPHSSDIYGLYIITAIFLALTILFYRLRKNKNRDLKNAIENEKIILLNYIKDNREALSRYSKEIDYILINNYNLKNIYQPSEERFQDYPEVDAKLHRMKKSSSEAAEIISREMIANSKAAEKLSLAEYGNYKPATQKLNTFSFFLVLFLTVYGIPQVFLGPNHDTFIPSDEWKDISQALVYILTCMIAFIMHRDKKFYKRSLKLHGKFGGTAINIIIIPTIFCFLYISIQMGAGKALNEIAGTEQSTFMAVTKNIDVHRNHEQSNSKQRYCVKIKSSTTFLSNKYCIGKEAYDKLPAHKDIMAKFNGKMSIFGYRIDGYYKGRTDFN